MEKRSDATTRTGLVQRAFAVLGAFDDSHRALRLADLARRAGLPANTTLRIARELVSAGALELDGRGHYIVGLRLFEIAALAPRGHGLRKTAMPFLEDLASAVGQHVLLTVRDGDKAVLVERLSARGAPAIKYRIGGRLPLDSTGAGLLLLAHAPAELQDAQIAAADEPLFPVRELHRRLADIRATNTVVVKPLPRSRVRLCTAAAGIRVDDRVIAAVSVVASAQQVDIAATLPAVITVAHSISRAMR